MDLTYEKTNNNQDIQIHRSNHLLDISITDNDILQLQQIFHNNYNLRQREFSSPDLQVHLILSHNSETTDISLNQFLFHLSNSLTSVICIHTYFSSEIFDKGWTTIAHKYFSLPNSSTHQRRRKPSLLSPIILFPVHIHGCHWIALTQCIINGIVHFFYVDDMLSPHTSSNIQEKFSQRNTLPEFHPSNARSICCNGIKYSPHSNECRSWTLLSLTILATHPSPHINMIIPWLIPILH